MTRRRAVITGLGPITAAGIGRDNFLQALKAGRSGIGPITTFDATGFRAKSAGEVLDYQPSEYFPPHRLKRLDRYAQFAVASSGLAFKDAGLQPDPQQPNPRAGVSFGTALGGISNAEAQHSLFHQSGRKAVNRSLALQVFGGSAHSNIAIEFGLRGPATTNSNSCASGTIAVGEALRFIQQGVADIIVAGGAEAPLSPLTFTAFDIIKTMSEADPGHAYRPFDRDRDGFVMGEGAGALIIEELEHARARGATIYAEVLGYALTNDAYHMTSPLPTCEAVVACMRGALQDAGLAPEAIEHINAHASSTQLNDSSETRAIVEVFGERGREIPVNGTKPFTAHPLGATGAMETIIGALTLHEQFIPPTLNYATPDPECRLNVVNGSGTTMSLRYLLSNSFGFGGINASLVLGAAPERRDEG